MSEQLDRLGRQLDAITIARAIAQEEPDGYERDRLLAVIDRARAAALEEYEGAAKTRPRFLLIKGGLAGGVIAAIAAHARKHPSTVAAVGVAAAATAIGTVVLYGTGDAQPATEPKPTAAAATPFSTHPHTLRPPQTTRAPHSAAPSTPGIPAATTPPDELSTLLTASKPHPTPTSSPTSSPTGTTPPPHTATPVWTQPQSTPPTTTAPLGLCLNLGLPPLVSLDACLPGHE